MAELNFGLLTPPGSQSIGNAFAQGMDQAAVARAQENQNALAQYTLGKAKREDELTNKMLAGLQGATTIEQQAAVLRSVGKVREASELMASDLERRYKLGQIEAQPGAQANTRAQTAVRHGTVMKNEATRVLADPTFDNAMRAVVNFGKATGQDVTQELATITAMGNDPVKIANWAKGHAVTGEQLLKQSVVKTVDTDMGGSISRQTYDAQGVAVGAPTIIPKTPTLGSVPGIAQADIARARAIDEGIPVPGAAPAQPGAPVTPAAFPRDTAVQQTTRMTDATAIKRQELANEQIKLANATQKLASPAAANDPDIRKFYEDQAKQATNNIASLNQELGGRTNNMPGAAAPVVNAMNAPSPREIREARAKGYAFNPDGTMSRISGGPADKTVVTRTPVQEVRFRKDLATDYTTTTATTQGMQDVLDSITDVKNSPGLAGATGISGMVYSLPGSQAAAAETNLANLKGKVTSLGQTLANASGKIGPMALQEWTIVRDMVAALDKAVSKGETITREELTKIDFAAKNVAKRVQDKFEGQYGDELSNYPQFATVPEPKSRLSGKIKPAGGGSVTTPKTPTVNIDALLKKYE